MATTLPPPSKKQKRIAHEAAVLDAESQQIPNDLGSVRLQFVERNTGGTVGAPLLLPLGQANFKTLEQLINSVQDHDREHHVPYKLYIPATGDDEEYSIPVTSTLYSALRQSSQAVDSLETSIRVQVEPQSIYRVKAVSRCSASVAGHGQTILAAAFSPSSASRLVSADGAGVAKIIDADTGTPVRSLNGHQGWVLAVAWSPDGKMISTGGVDKMVRLWDAETGKELCVLRGHSGYISSLAWEPIHLQEAGRPRLASSSRDGTVRIWDVVSGRLDVNITCHRKKVTCVKWGGTGNIYTTSHDMLIKIYSASGTLLSTLKKHAHRVNHLALSTDYMLRTGAFDNIAELPRTESLRKQQAQERFDQAARYKGQIAERFVTASDDHTMFLWDTNDLSKPVARLLGHQNDIIHVCISSNGIIASSSFDKSLRLWSAMTGAYILTLRGHVAPVYAAAFSPDGRLLASCSKDGTAKIWDVTSGKLVEDLVGSKGAILCVDWSPTGGSGDTRVRFEAQVTRVQQAALNYPHILQTKSCGEQSYNPHPTAQTSFQVVRSTTLAMAESPSSQILRPQPRRPAASFSLTPISTHDSSVDQSSEPASEKSTPNTSPSLRDPRSNAGFGENEIQPGPSTPPPQKTRSILNLTSSTLFGIYSPSESDISRDSNTPWGVGTQTPARGSSRNRGSPSQLNSYTHISTRDDNKNTVAIDAKETRPSNITRETSVSHVTTRRSPGGRAARLTLSMAVLFLLGMAYGEVIAHLHDKRDLAPVRVDAINRESWTYVGFWGIAGLVLGLLVPWVDSLQKPEKRKYENADADTEDRTQGLSGKDDQDAAERDEARQTGSFGTTWSPVIRCVGAFVGIALAIRRLPWQSTLQVSLTLALVNPVIWYLVDRTKSGLVLASFVGVAGTAVSLVTNPHWVPSPTTSAQLSSSSPTFTVSNATEWLMQETNPLVGFISLESAGVMTWMASVLFCSCIFFGSIGRRLVTDHLA
ncbi:MAG: hypothetical protein M1828_000033 [Chrysothrix sp. TS-e1954]|nr:MAG: hypothetical protein M1828_000033 [Chrysothrix sp. TS-e1954]